MCTRIFSVQIQHCVFQFKWMKWNVSFLGDIPLENQGGKACTIQAVFYVLQSCHIILNLADSSWKEKELLKIKGRWNYILERFNDLVIFENMRDLWKCFPNYTLQLFWHIMVRNFKTALSVISASYDCSVLCEYLQNLDLLLVQYLTTFIVISFSYIKCPLLLILSPWTAGKGLALCSLHRPIKWGFSKMIHKMIYKRSGCFTEAVQPHQCKSFVLVKP